METKQIKREDYTNYLTWETPLSEEVMAHSDGVCTTMIPWSGFDCEMQSETELVSTYQKIENFIHKIGEHHCVEFHWWHDKDESSIDAYLAMNSEIKRGRDLAIPMREAIAEHYRPLARSNNVAIVVSRHSQTIQNPFKAIFNNAEYSWADKVENGKALLEETGSFMDSLPGAKYAHLDYYAKRIQQSMHRTAFKKGHKCVPDYGFDLSDQFVYQAPTVTDDGLIEVDGSFTKVILMYLYPDAAPGFFLAFSSMAIDMHVVQIIRPMNTRKHMDAMGEKIETDSLTTGKKGSLYASAAIMDAKQYREYVVHNGLRSFQNVYIIHLHGSREELHHHSAVISNWVSGDLMKGEVRMHRDLQAHFFRVAQPGLGRYSEFSREDNTRQIARMSPVVVYDKGSENPQSIWMQSSGQVLGESYSERIVNSAIMVAMTGAGKGVKKSKEIIETYPWISWYIMEMGDTYRWIVEGFGGNYISVDENTVINPLPDYSYANPVGSVEPINIKLLMGTVEALPILVNQGKDYSDAQRGAMEHAVKSLYIVSPGDKHTPTVKQAPTMSDLLTKLKEETFPNASQTKAAEKMAENLDDFLSTEIGKNFLKEDNFTISPGICGVDLLGIEHLAPHVVQFYIMFIALRFSQMAFFKLTEPARILVDELFAIREISPETVRRVTANVSRMGRKNNASIDLVTQGMEEIDLLDKEIKTGAYLRSWLYRPDGHAAIGLNESFKMPPKPLSIWSSYKDPLNQNWRQGLYSIGQKYYDLFLSFPMMLMDISFTDPSEREMKVEIGKQTSDVFERMRLLRQMIESRKKQ